MHMILDPADHQGRTVPFPKDARLVLEQVSLVSLRNPSLTVLGAVDQMHQILDEGLGHG